MAIFWGMGSKSKNYENLWIPYYCSVCDEFSSFAVTENYRYGQVYGIRIAKYKAKHFLVCQKCDRVIVLGTREQFDKAQEIARRLAATPSDSVNYMSYVAEIARWVLNNSELADTIEENERNKYLEDPSTPAKEIPAETSETKECPECAETIKLAAKRCRFCNYVYE